MVSRTPTNSRTLVSDLIQIHRAKTNESIVIMPLITPSHALKFTSLPPALAPMTVARLKCMIAQCDDQGKRPQESNRLKGAYSDVIAALAQIIHAGGWLARDGG